MVEEGTVKSSTLVQDLMIAEYTHDLNLIKHAWPWIFDELNYDCTLSLGDYYLTKHAHKNYWLLYNHEESREKVIKIIVNYLIFGSCDETVQLNNTPLTVPPILELWVFKQYRALRNNESLMIPQNVSQLLTTVGYIRERLMTHEEKEPFESEISFLKGFEAGLKYHS